MARRDVHELGMVLTATDLSCVPDGEHHIDSIYAFVQSHHRSLCDDTYRCAQNCHRGHQQPEWKHAVRRVLYDASRRGKRVSRGGKHGHWLFDEGSAKL